MIQNREPIIIATDWSKSKKISGGSWIIADTKGSPIIERSNPDFGSIQQIHSHRVDFFGILTVFLFLDEYCRYYILANHSKVTYYRDNLGVVTKLRNIKRNPHYYDEYIRTTDHNVIKCLQLYIPSSIAIHHVSSHQNKRKK